jgi:hypothetical protein
MITLLILLPDERESHLACVSTCIKSVSYDETRIRLLPSRRNVAPVTTLSFKRIEVRREA